MSWTIFSQFGTRIISVTPGRSDTAGMGTILSSVQLLTMADRNSLARLPHAEYVIPSLQGSGSIRYGERSRSTEIHGTSADFTRAWSFPLAQGRFLPDSGGGPSPAFCGAGPYRLAGIVSGPAGTGAVYPRQWPALPGGRRYATQGLHARL